MTDFRAKRLAIASLVLMAMLWGSSFVVTKGTLNRVDAMDLLAMRYTLALGVLVLLAWRHLSMGMRTVVQGLVMGALYSFGQITQTIGLNTTSASISGFLTGTYVVFTPLLARITMGERVRRNVWRGAALAFLGLGVLSVSPGGGGSFGMGETLTLLGALGFAGHIMATGHFATDKNAMSLTLVQTGAIAALSWAMALPDGLVIPGNPADWFAIVYLAVIAGALTLFLQSWAQVYVEPTRAAVIMCSEPVWAAVFAVSFGTESLTWQMVIGGAAIVGAMYLVVAPKRRLRVTGRVGALSQALEGGPRGVDHWPGDLGRYRHLGGRVSLQASIHQRT